MGETDWGGPLRATQSALYSLTQGQDASGGAAASYSSQAALPSRGIGRRGALPPVPTFAAGSAQASFSEALDASQDCARGAGSVSRRFGGAGLSAPALDVIRAANARRRGEISAAARTQRVQAFRQYRAGEVPDIALCAFDFVAPLQSLAQNDPVVAKLVLVHLYERILQQRLGVGGSGVEAQTRRLHGGVAALLNSRAGGPAFVACLHELALTEEETSSWLEPADVAASAQRTGTLHTAARLLERHLLSAEPEPRASKRARAEQVILVVVAAVVTAAAAAA